MNILWPTNAITQQKKKMIVPELRLTNASTEYC